MATADLLRELANREALPETYVDMAELWFRPLAEWLCARLADRDRPLLIGIHGAQGTGKTTLCKVLELFVGERGKSVQTLALDDFYLGKEARAALATTIHTLLVTRGVPGTHEVSLINATLDALLDRRAARVPVFDKALDDRLPEQQWREVQPADIILLEGWCIGSTPEQEDRLREPINDLERREDADSIWRRYVNNRLASDYAALFGRLDGLVMLQAPSMRSVLEWRTLQEQKLARHREGEGVMGEAAIARFVQHYERITRHSLVDLPGRADYLLQVAEDHSIVGANPAGSSHGGGEYGDR